MRARSLGPHTRTRDFADRSKSKMRERICRVEKFYHFNCFFACVFCRRKNVALLYVDE